MEEKILKTIKKYNLIENGDKLVVGVSGGPDSITLLNILLKIKKQEIIKFDIVVCHINHMIRKEAIADEEYVANYCKENDIEYFIKRVKVEEISKKEKCRYRRGRKKSTL